MSLRMPAAAPRRRLVPMLLLTALALATAGCTALGPPLGPAEQARIAGRAHVVTGASSGIGRGVAERLGALGGNVVLAARRGPALEEVAAVIRASGGQALAVPTDVSDPAAVEALARAAEARFGRIDVWINNAAVGALGRFEEVPLEDHLRVVDVNLKGTIQGSHAALRRFRAQGHGTLVNIGSVEGRVPLAYHASYAATKHAVSGLGGALNQELRLNGLSDRVRVVTILPWAVDTPFWRHAANYTGRTARGPMMDGAREVADAVVWSVAWPRAGEVALGWKAEGALLGHRVWPALAERISGDVIQRVQMELPPPAPPTAGSLYVPAPTGSTAVEGGARERVAREDAAARTGR